MSFDVSDLWPFGVKIEAYRGHSVLEIEPRCLDRLAQASKLVLLRGFEPLGRGQFLEYCRSFPGRGLLEWDFGPVMEMHEKPDPKNYLFSREAVPYHWDGAFHRVPSYLAFCCVEAPVEGAGGETLFCDTERVWEAASPMERAQWSGVTLTYETAKLAHYGGRITGPLVQRHPSTGKTILRFAEPVATELNPVSLQVSGIENDDQSSFIDDMKSRIYAPQLSYAHRWEPGDLLIADNHSLIHGRRAFAKDSPRHLRRVQLI